MAFTVFPLHGIIRDAEGVRCACRDPKCSDIGKHPAVRWKRLEAGEQIHGHAGHGLATGVRSGVFVVDTDGPEADERFRAMGPLPPTHKVKTGRPEGGFHYYFRWPGFPVISAKNVLGPKIDVRGDGGYVVTAGSPHVSGGVYAVKVNIGIADAPDWLVNDPRIKGRALSEEAGENAPVPLERSSPIWDERVELGAKACREWEPHGGTTMFKLAIRLVRDLELPLDESQRLVEEVYNPRAVDESGQPWPWDPKDIRYKLEQARDKSEKKPGDAWDITLPKPTGQEGVEDFLANLTKPEEVSDNPLGVEYGGLDEDQPIEYQVEGILPVASVGMMVAQPYVMKTWAAYSLAIAVSQGKPWLGKHKTKQGKVLILDYEMGPRKAKRRLRMLGDDGSIGRITNPNFRLDQLELWKHLFDLKPALVIIDSLSAGNRVSEEKDPKFALPLDYAKKMANACDCSFIVIHHAVKDTAGKSKHAWVRGSGAIFGALDVCYVLESVSGGEGREKRATVECLKMREGDEPKPFTLSLTDERGITLHQDTPDEQVLHDRGGDIKTAIRLSIGKQGPCSGVAMATERLRRNVAEVRKVLKAMEEDGELVFLNNKWHLDGPKLRQERIIQAALETKNQMMVATPTKLAKLAHVQPSDVEKLMADGRLARTSEGSAGAWFVPNDAD